MIEYYINYKKPSLYSFENVDVEIGFGKGDFLVKKAVENPEKTFLGFEISLVSVKNLYKKIKKSSITNIRYTKVDAVVGFQILLKDETVDNIYINYPDPFPKKRDYKRRITREYALQTFAKKLKVGGNIYIRTDHEDFFNFTIENLNKFQCFSFQYGKLNVEQPLTKYEKKWLSQGKNLYFINIKKKNSYLNPLEYEFKEVNLYPLKVEKKPINLDEIENREFRIDKFTVVKFMEHAQKKNSILLETLLSENGFLQKFYVRIKEKDKDLIIDVSPFSDVLLTEGVQKVINLVGEQLFS